VEEIKEVDEEPPSTEPYRDTTKLKDLSAHDFHPIKDAAHHRG